MKESLVDSSVVLLNGTYFDGVCFELLSCILDGGGCTTKRLAGQTFCSLGNTPRCKKKEN